MVHNSNPLELLMPAGSLSKMELALDYGANAVYLGPPLYSLRARENHFRNDELRTAIETVHSKGKKAYMTLNIFARNRKLKPFSEDISELAAMKPDAFIISDPGLASIAREKAPQIPLHLSVQANCMNWQAVKFWQKSLGVERVILSRELSIHEIQEIKQRVPEMELEAFVHGSICIAYSGRCLLSSYMDKRDANQGVCDNSCREKFKVWGQEFYLEDTKHNPNQYFPIEEDEHGTYILNAKDLCMIEHLKKLADAGVISFKVEGRTKSEFYAAMVARSYRGALDDMIAGRDFNPVWLGELQKLSNRGFHTAFMLNQPQSEGQNYQASQIYNETVRFLGLIRQTEESEAPLVEIKNKMKVGQKVRWISPNGETGVSLIEEIKSLKGESKSEVHSGAGSFYFKMSGTHPLANRSILLTEENNF